MDLIIDWIPEQELAPGPPFPAVTTSTGTTITSAHEARQALIVTIAGIDVSFRRHWDQRPEAPSARTWPDRSPAQLAARDFPDHAGESVAPAASGSAPAATGYAQATPAADRLAGPRRHPQ